MPTLRYVTCDVFTDTPLAGNQLAVFTDARGVADELMLALALEVGYSETVFVAPAEEGGHARIRIFTPAFELPFAGHPVLGTAFVLGAPLQLGAIVLETGRGPVSVTLERDESGRIVFGRMQQPVPSVELYDNGARHVLVTLASADAVAALAPDAQALAALDVTGVSCFARSGTGWKTRMFWSRGEDAATGSAAGPIACHLARHGLADWGEEIVIAQGAEIGRPSVLHARAEGGGGLIDAVEVGGSAVVVARGEFRLPG